MKKLFALVLVLALIACAGPSVAETALPESVDLTFFRPIFSASPQGTAVENEWLRMMEEHLGVKLNITWEELPYEEYLTKMPVYMAAGEWADAFQVSNVPYSQICDYGEQGLLLNLKDYLGDDSYYMNFVNSSVANTVNMTANDGNIYGFGDGHVSITDNGTQYTWGVRFDVMTDNGLVVPTSMQEIYDVSVALKEIYPDSFPVTIGYGDMKQWFRIYQSNITVMYNGEQYVYAPYRMKDVNYEVLNYLHKLYAEGLLDPEWLTDSFDQFYVKYLTNGSFITSAIYGSHIAERLNENGEYDVTWGMIDAPKNLEGEPGYRFNDHNIGKFLVNGSCIVVNANTAYPELVAKLVDYQYSDEMVDLTNWGIENVTYVIDANGEKDYTDEIKNASLPSAKLAEYGVNQSMSCRSGLLFLPQLNDAAKKLQKANPYYYNGEFGSAVHWTFYGMTRDNFDNAVPAEPAQSAFSSQESEDVSINLTALDTYVSEEYVKFIMGDRDLADYDAFIDNMSQYGDIELVENIYNSHIVIG